MLLELYCGKSLVASTDREKVKANKDLLHIGDIGYWMLRAIKEDGSSLSVQEAKRLGEWRFSNAYPDIEGYLKRLAKLGVVIQAGKDRHNCIRYDIGDISEYSVLYKPPKTEDSEFKRVADIVNQKWAAI